MKKFCLTFLLSVAVIFNISAQFSSYWDNPYKVWGTNAENRIKDGAVWLGYAKPETTKVFVSLKKGDPFPDRIFELTNLTVLDMSGSYEGCCASVGVVSDKLNTLTKLQYIYFNSIGVTHLPGDLSTLTALKSISIGTSEALQALPDFSKLPALQVVYLAGNEKIEFALAKNFETIFSNPNLKILALSGGMMTAESLSSINRLTQLEVLELSGNKTLKSLPDLSANTTLQQLVLRGSGVEKLGPDIGSLTNLKAVDMAYNNLTTLPTEIGGLKKVRYIDLMNNQLTSLPNSMGEMDALENIVLRGNSFKEIPECIYQMKNLKELDLMETEISTLDKRLLETKITTLRISHKKPGAFSFDPKMLAEMKTLKKVQMTTLKADPDVLKAKQQLKKLRPDISIN